MAAATLASPGPVLSTPNAKRQNVDATTPEVLSGMSEVQRKDLYATAEYTIGQEQTKLVHIKGTGNVPGEVGQLSTILMSACGQIHELVEVVNKHAEAFVVHHGGLKNSHRRIKTIEEGNIHAAENFKRVETRLKTAEEGLATLRTSAEQSLQDVADRHQAQGEQIRSLADDLEAYAVQLQNADMHIRERLEDFCTATETKFQVVESQETMLKATAADLAKSAYFRD